MSIGSNITLMCTYKTTIKATIHPYSCHVCLLA